MKLEQKNMLLKASQDQYVVIRDEDWEVLCLLSYEDDKYTVYSLEQYVLMKEDIYKILDKAAWISLLDKIYIEWGDDE